MSKKTPWGLIAIVAAIGAWAWSGRARTTEGRFQGASGWATWRVTRREAGWGWTYDAVRTTDGEAWASGAPRVWATEGEAKADLLVELERELGASSAAGETLGAALGEALQAASRGLFGGEAGP